MGIASLILGIISFGLCLIPGLGVLAIIPIIVSITLGIIKLVKLSKSNDINLKETKINSIIGIVLSSVGLCLMIFWICLIFFIFSIIDSYEDDFTNMIQEDNNVKTEQNKELDEYKESIRKKL